MTDNNEIESDHFYWWQQGTLYHAQRGGEADFYTSTHLTDALEQAGYDSCDPLHIVHPNEHPGA